MIHAELLQDPSLLIITPEGKLQQSDFESIAKLIDPYIESEGKLCGVLIFTESFPGWADYAALLSHLKFVKNHSQYITKLAVVTDSQFLSILSKIVSPFVHAQVRHFGYGDKQQALSWLQNRETKHVRSV